MGTCNSQEDLIDHSSLSKLDFDFIKLIGRGASGAVWKARHKRSQTSVAIKVFTKSEIQSKESLITIFKELQMLSFLSHCFLVNLHFAFQDSQKLYIGLDLKLGGDLRYHINSRKFTEAEIKFIIFCVVECLGYLHSQGIIHKDVKPENILIDSKGYAFLTDLGASTVMRLENFEETSGTPGYMAPEVICRQNHSFVSDYFGLGVILYEVILKQRPYLGKGRKDIRSAILNKQAKIKKEDLTEWWSEECLDFCNLLLKRKPERRLGALGIREVKDHVWFSGMDEEMARNFKAKPAFVPDPGDNFDKDYVKRKRIKLKNKNNLEKNDLIGFGFKPKLGVYYA